MRRFIERNHEEFSDDERSEDEFSDDEISDVETERRHNITGCMRECSILHEI